MLITKLKLNYFGRFQNKEMNLKPGINLIYGENEAGKSTIHTFIKGMLFGIDRMRGRGAASKEDTYTRYLPWDYPGAYGGSMEITIDQKEYILSRSFHASDRSFTILDKATGREVRLKEGLLSELVPGLTEATFKNTMSIEQLKASTDAELAIQVRNYIANLSVTKSKEINIAKAINLLSEQRKQYDLNQTLSRLKALQNEINEGVEKEERIDQLTLQLKELQAKEIELKRKKARISVELDQEATIRMEQYPAILEKYCVYLDLSKQCEALELQEEELRLYIIDKEKEQNASALLKEAIKEAEQLRSQLIRLEQEGMELQREKEVVASGLHGLQPLAVSMPFFFFALLIVTIIDPKPLGYLLGAIMLGIGVLFHYALNKNRKQRLIDSKQRLIDSNAILSEHNSKKNLILRRLEELRKTYQVANLEELVLKQEELIKNYYSLENARKQKTEIDQRKKNLEDNKDLLYETIMKYMQHFIHEDELTQHAMQRLQEEIRKLKLDNQTRLEAISKQQEEYKLLMEKLRWEIQTMEGNEELLIRNKDQYVLLEKKLNEDNLELEAVNLALKTIQELSAGIHDSFGQQLNHAVSEVIREVTDQRYCELKVDEKLDIKLGWKGNYVMLDRLSAGTIDQVYFSLRLAVADLLLGEDTVPLLLDDSFALYDDTRVKAALKKLSQRQQVLLFTCHRREEQLLKELQISFHSVELTQ